MKFSDSDIWLIIISSWITIITFCYQCITVESDEKIRMNRELKKQIEAQKKR